MKQTVINRCFCNCLLLFSLDILWLQGAYAQTSLPSIPKPNMAPNAAPAPVETSVIDIPVTLPLQLLSDQLESGITRQQDAMGAWSEIGKTPIGVTAIRYKFWRNPLNIAMTGNKLSIGVQAYYFLDFAQRHRNGIWFGGYSWAVLGSCGHNGEPAREARVQLDTEVSWSPNWHLKSSTSVSPIQFPNQCKLTFISVNVTQKIKDILQPKINDAAKTIDSRLQEHDFKPVADRAWQKLSAPIDLGAGAWLLLQPETVRASAISGTGIAVTSSVGITAHPKVIVGDMPQTPGAALPDLRLTAPGNGFHIALEGELSFDAATDILTKKLVGRRYPIENNLIKITDVSIYGTGDVTVVQLGIDGSLKGTIFLQGRVAYDAIKQVLYVQDLDFSVETKDFVTKLAAGWLLNRGFTQSLAAAAKFPLSLPIQDVTDLLKQKINHDFGNGITMTGDITALRPIGIYTIPTAFKALIVTDGKAQITIR